MTFSMYANWHGYGLIIRELYIHATERIYRHMPNRAFMPQLF